MSSGKFTDQKPRRATQEDLEANWSGSPDNFRCYMCGYKFQLGDYWRWIYANCAGIVMPITGQKVGLCNFKVCEACDGPDVLERWVQKHKDFYSLSNWIFWK